MKSDMKLINPRIIINANILNIDLKTKKTIWKQLKIIIILLIIDIFNKFSNK
jgi:hypothetical protein